MSLIEVGETGSWLAHFFEKTVGSYAKKIAELYYLSFSIVWILSSYRQHLASSTAFSSITAHLCLM